MQDLIARRLLLARIAAGRRRLAEALQKKMFDLMEENERRLSAYRKASARWAEVWPSLAAEMERLPLLDAQARMVASAAGVLPERIRT